MVAQALVFAIGAVTRIELFADHFTVRLQRRGFSPSAVVAGVRGKRFHLTLATGASVVCRTSWTDRTSRTIAAHVSRGKIGLQAPVRGDV